MENYKGKLEEQLKEIEALLVKSNHNLAKLCEISDDGIRIHKSNGCIQYSLVDKKTGESHYVKGCEVPALRRIAQKDYEKKIRKELLALKHHLETFLTHYDIQRLNEIYYRMADGRKVLIEPIIETDEHYLEGWKKEQYKPMPFYDDTEFYTGNGVRVRSKSELIIANLLEQYAVPYQYEKPMILKGMGQVRPDFTCLRIQQKKEVLWEHFGMMDQGMYANKNVEKIGIYHQNGYYIGDNLIMTFETSQNPISSKQIRNMIEHYLL